MATKKKVAKKAAKKATKKATAKKKTVKKAVGKVNSKKVAKVSAKKPSAKKATARKASAKKATARKAPAKKAPAKKAPAKKAPAKKAPAKKAPAKKDPVKKAPAKKAVAKKEEIPKPVAKKKVVPKRPLKLTAFVKKQRQRLLDLQDELMDAMYGVQQETILNAPSGSEASGSGMHQGDAGSDAYDRDFALNLLSKEQDALQEIQAALERISAGYYGICEISGLRIPQARLEAIPFARLTVECQSRWEEEHPHRQFRAVDALGFGGLANGAIPVSLDAAGE